MALYYTKFKIYSDTVEKIIILKLQQLLYVMRSNTNKFKSLNGCKKYCTKRYNGVISTVTINFYYTASYSGTTELTSTLHEPAPSLPAASLELVRMSERKTTERSP